MNVDGQLIRAVFIDRPNRFITTVRINEEIHSSHLPDPGRLRELLIPGVELLDRPKRLETDGTVKMQTITAANTIDVVVSGKKIT